MAFINATSPQQHIILEPPRLINGSVTPVHGRRSVTPNTCRAAWKRRRPERSARSNSVKRRASRHSIAYTVNHEGDKGQKHSKCDNNSEFLTYHSERQVLCGGVYISQLAVSYSESEKSAADGIYEKSRLLIAAVVCILPNMAICFKAFCDIRLKRKHKTAAAEKLPRIQEIWSLYLPSAGMPLLRM